MEERLNKREMMVGLVRACFGMVLVYLAFIGSLGNPATRFETSIMALAATVFAVALSLFIPERWAVGAWLFFIIDAAAVGACVWFLGGLNSWAVYFIPLLAVSAVYRFSADQSLAVSVALAAGIIAFASFNRQGTLYQAFMWAAIVMAVWAVSVQRFRVSQEEKYRMMYLDQEKAASELEKKIRELEEKLQSHTITDTVTGLKNFRYFRARLEEEVARAQRKNQVFSLALMEIEDMPDFSKVYGEQETRKALARLAARLKDAFRNTDLLCRYSDTQFMMLLTEADAKNSLVPIMRMRKNLEKTSFGPDNRFQFSYSFGISCYPYDAREAGGLLSLASASLRRSRQKGSGMITLASSLFKKGPVS